MDVWYYAINGEQNGPVDKTELQRLIASGAVKPGDYVWTEGMRDWQAAGRVPELAAGLPPASPPLRAPDREAEEDGGETIPNYLPWAILVTLCCCLPGGIASIIYSVQATSQRNAGNWTEARLNAERARNWLIWSVVLGALANVAWLVISLLQGIGTFH